MKLTITLCLVFFSLVFLRVDGQCGDFIASDGSVYFLDPFTLTTTDYQGTESPFNYYWNFCRDTVHNLCEFRAPAIQIDTSVNICYQIGYLANLTISDHPKGPFLGFQLTYTNTIQKCAQNTINRVTNIIVDCNNSSETTVLSVSEPERCYYVINMRSKYACPVPQSVPTLSYILPTSGPLAGGTRVFVVGSGFIPLTICRFGSILITPTYENDQVIICTSPPSPFSGEAQVAVSNDAKNWSTNDSVTFTWV